MKRFGNLYPEIIKFENLWESAKKAERGMRFRGNVLAFNYNLERELLTLQTELTSKTYQPGAYRTFYIKEPKSWMISAAPYRDRVVHHALCNIIVPIDYRTNIYQRFIRKSGRVWYTSRFTSVYHLCSF